FAAGIDRSSLSRTGMVRDGDPASALGGRLVLVAGVFAPASLPTRVRLEWRTVRTSREVEIVAHEAGFRVWDALTADVTPLVPGEYSVVMRTAEGRWFGRAAVRLE